MKRVQRRLERMPPTSATPQLFASLASINIVLEDDEQRFEPPVPRLASKELYDSDYDL